MKKAAIYLRSSKDRSDVSIAAQRRELQQLALSKGLTIAHSYEDAVESGKTEDRPAFQQLCAAIKNRDRGWSHLLCLDTSRLARNRYIAQWIKRDCSRHGVEILYAKLPETDPVTSILLESVFEGIDEWHSAMSREKGLAGMRENVRQGWRAGGRAPTGYRLQRHATGAMREGVPVSKSKLVVAPDSNRIAAYLRDRARGVPRVRAAADHEVTLPPNSLIDVEWNALVYAGHTVWNRHTDKRSRGSGAPKRRPREEWVIERDTHEALITETEAEGIMAQLATSKIGMAVSRAKASMSGYLLTGLLETGDGRRWVGAGKYYRLKAANGQRGRKVDVESIDRAVLAQITETMRSDEFVATLATAAKRSGAQDDPAAPIRAEIAKLGRERDRAAQLALGAEDPSPFMALVAERGRQIAAMTKEADQVASNNTLEHLLGDLTPTGIREILLAAGSPTAVLRTFVDRVVLEPDLSCQIRYRLVGSRCLNLASPRDRDRWTLPVGVKIA